MKDELLSLISQIEESQHRIRRVIDSLQDPNYVGVSVIDAQEQLTHGGMLLRELKTLVLNI